MWKLCGNILAGVFLLFLASSALAPTGDRRIPAGRTLASIQEEEFDDQLLRLRLCYGLEFISPSQSSERRRACKAIVLHAAKKELSSGPYWLESPLVFRCEDTQQAQKEWTDLNRKKIITLRPNAEEERVVAAIQESRRGKESLTGADFAELQGVCRAAVHCEKLLHYQSFSLPRLRACLSGKGSVRHSVILGVLREVLFAGQRQSPPLANRLLDGR